MEEISQESISNRQVKFAMLRIASELYSYEVRATDTKLGKVHDFCFDQRSWDIQYLAVDVGRWFCSRKNLIPTSVLRQPDWEVYIFPVGLAKKDIKRDLKTDPNKLPHYQWKSKLPDDWPLYWGGGRLLFAGLFHGKKVRKPPAVDKDGGYSNLWTLKELLGYRIQANDGESGQVIDFVVNCQTWFIQYVVVDMLDFPSGKKVLVETKLIKDIDSSDSRLLTDLTQEAIMSCPEFDHSSFTEGGTKGNES